ncbi:hypothetical protein [Nocardiopsis sp. CNT312]|uniref:hypothetical protein n=1 Tax=Nocardiopsis sp. CNT312 TaxID=1137268 RepID=UPI00048DB19A|nr:hypothetical protein [Nocardiopsis sp. CNT312]
MSTYDDTEPDQGVEVPNAEPLPDLDETERAAAGTTAPDPVPEETEALPGDTGQESSGEPPPLPPLLELATSNAATASGLAYGAAGPAGLAAMGAVAAVAGAAYLAHGARRRSAARRGASAVPAGGRGGGRFRGLLGRGAGTGRGPGAGRGQAGTGRFRAGVGLPGRARSVRSGAAPLGLGRRGGGRGVLPRSAAGGLGRTGPTRGAARPSLGGRVGGVRGGSRAFRPGVRSPRISGGAGRWGGARGFAPRGRSTSITDPAAPRPSGRRPLGRAWGGLRRGWSHPRVKAGRVRVRRASGRTRDYVRARIRRLRAGALWRALTRWWGRLWSRVRSDDRYGPMSDASAAASALAVAVLGASERSSRPRRALTGRVIGTSARTPGEITAGQRLAIGAGGSGAPVEGHVMNKPNEIIRAESAADEMRAALAAFGGADVHMLTYEGGLQALPGMLRTIGSGLHEMSAVAQSEQPLHPAVVQYMHQLSAAVHQVADVADELPGLFRAAHETELQRLEAPRAGEHRWDASQRDD